MPLIGDLLRQASQAARAIIGRVFGYTYYVDSANGVDGNSGLDWYHALATLGRGLALAQAGDTIVLRQGGGETLTAALSVAAAGVKIVCECENPANGYALTAAGTLGMLTVSAANVVIQGIQFKHTGTTANARGILTTAAADNLVVNRCVFDDSAIVTNFTGAGVELVDDTDNARITHCLFKDCQFGVKFTIATGGTCSRPAVDDCIFYVGKSAAFGIASALTGAGKVLGLRSNRCEFLEANGDGTAATVAWDGTDGTNANQGPIKLEAAVDQFIIADARAYTALTTTTFVNINAINAGAAGSVVGCKTSTDASDLSTIIALHAKPTADATTNTNMRDVTGNKADAVLTAVGTTKSIAAYVKTILQNVGFLADAAVYAVDTSTSIMAYVKGLVNGVAGIAISSTGAMHDGDTIFTITGGPIRILALWSECVTGNDGTASTVKYTATPTSGSAQDISGASASIASAAAGASIALAGTALSTGALYNANGPNLVANPGTVIAPAGVIKVGLGVGSTTGTWKHYIRYEPMKKGTTVA